MSKKIKVLYIHHGQGIGGASISLLQMAKELDKKKFEVSVLFLKESSAIKLFEKEKIKILGPLKISDFSHTKIWWYRWFAIHHQARAIFSSLKVYFFLARFIFFKEKPDILHLNTTSMWAWSLVAKKLKIKVITHVREPLAKGYFGLRKNFTKKMVEISSDIILPICYNDSNPWKNSKKVKILYNSVDQKRFF